MGMTHSCPTWPGDPNTAATELWECADVATDLAAWSLLLTSALLLLSGVLCWLLLLRKV